MAWYIVPDKSLPIPDASQQSDIHQLMLIARKVWLSDALKSAMEDVDPAILRSQIDKYVPKKAQQALAIAGIRDEAAFPIPVVLEARPTLIAYYRLLLGISRKRFYTKATGMAPFQKLEDGAELTRELQSHLPAYCMAMSRALADLIAQTDSSLESRDLEDLQLLTLGSYYYGSLNNKIGVVATLGVYRAIVEIVGRYIRKQSAKMLQLAMPNGREIHIIVAGDPDMRIVEIEDNEEGSEIPIVSIEIKGGTDSRNTYNRGGEAEKSHQGSKERGFAECWTIINTANIDMAKLMRGSPTTTAWFNANQVVSQVGNDWLRFQSAVREAIGLTE